MIIIRTIVFFLGILLPISNLPVIAASSITLTIEPVLLQNITQKFLPHIEKRQFNGVLDLAITQQPWSVNVQFTITKVIYTVQSSSLVVSVHVHVNADGYKYNTVANGVVKPKISGETLVLDIVRINLPLSVQVLGTKINLGSIPANSFLPKELKRATINLRQFGLTIITPKNESLLIRPVAPKISYKNNAITISSPLNY